MPNPLSNILKQTPKNPWIYQFFDVGGKIIYIWKSVNLFSRVNSYFNWKWKLNFAKKKMVDQVVDIKIIITENETESLILETTLIKKYKPKYNILMKDDKNYVYIKITDDVIPKVIKTRIKNHSWTYFGPYISTNYVNNILKLVKKLFWYCSCNIIFDEDENWAISIKSTHWTKIPCMDYYIWRCAWPCLLEKDKIKNYYRSIENIKNFLKWDYKEIIKSLEEKMLLEAKKLNFEEAKKIKENIESIKSLEISQNMREAISWDYKIINYIEKYDKFYIWLIEVEDSKITWYHNFEIETKLWETTEEILTSFIEQIYAEDINKNIKYLLPISLEFEDKNLQNKLEIPKIWTKVELLKLVYKNIYDYAYKKHLNSLSTKGFTKQTQKNLLEILWYKQINKDIVFECNDISHLSWSHTVASRSIIENWKSNTSKYKKFNIKTLESWKIDDFSSLKEIMERRLKEIEKTWFIPDLIIIDGWKWQLSSVMKIINSYPLLSKEGARGWSKLQLVSIAKREEELFLPISKPIPSPLHSEVLPLTSREEINEHDFKRILLDKESTELRLVQKIRDEAHRFAITFNRDKRIKSMKKNILESLPWIWPKTRKKILKKFGSIDAIKKEELESILTKKQIEILEDHGII